MKNIILCIMVATFLFNSCAHAQTHHRIGEVTSFFDRTLPFNKIENYSISEDGTITIIYDGFAFNSESFETPNEYFPWLCLDILSMTREFEAHKIKLLKIFGKMFRSRPSYCETNGSAIVVVDVWGKPSVAEGVVYNINRQETQHFFSDEILNPGFMGCFDPQNRFYLIDQTNDSLRCRIFDADYQTMTRKNFAKNVAHLKKIYWDNDNDYYLTYTYQNASIHNNHLINVYGMQKVPHNDNRPAWEKQNIAELVGVEIVDMEGQTVSDLQYWELPEIAVQKTLQEDYAKVKMLTAEDPSLSMKIFIGGISENVPGIFEIHLDNNYQPIKYTQMQKGEPAAVTETAPLQDYQLLDLVYNRRRDELSLLMIDKSSVDTVTPLTRYQIQQD